MSGRELQKRYRPIDEQIVRELLSVRPEGWWSICLEVQSSDPTAGENALSLSIFNDEGQTEVVVPPAKLYELVLSHANVFNAIGKPWKRLNYKVSFDESIDNWRFTIDYDY